MMVHLSVLPVGEEVHLSEPIAKAVKIVHDSGLDYRLTPMGTLIQGEWREVMNVVKKCHEAVRKNHDRVITQIKIDDHKDGKQDFDDKVKAVEEKAGAEFRK